MRRYLVHDVAEECHIHPNTVRRLEREGILKANRDYNNHRVFSKEEVMKLKRMLNGNLNSNRSE